METTRTILEILVPINTERRTFDLLLTQVEKDHCQFCKGTGHYPRQCGTKRRFDRAFRKAGIGRSWGVVKQRFTDYNRQARVLNHYAAQDRVNRAFAETLAREAARHGDFLGSLEAQMLAANIAPENRAAWLLEQLRVEQERVIREVNLLRPPAPPAQAQGQPQRPPPGPPQGPPQGPAQPPPQAQAPLDGGMNVEP